MVPTAMMLAEADMEATGTEKEEPKTLGVLGEATFLGDQQEAQERLDLEEMPPQAATRSPQGAEEGIMAVGAGLIMAAAAVAGPLMLAE